VNNIHTDFLVIGSGVAGLRAAIELSHHGRVLIVTKDIPTESCTEYAQGGVAVALSDEDEVGIHFEDTIKAGAGLCKEEAVTILVEEGPARILELIEWGAAFDKEGAKLAFTREAAHSRRRVVHAQGDSTGREMERVLLQKVISLKGVKASRFSTAVDLIIKDGICTGATILRGTDFIAVHAKATVLATGGSGQVFSRTTNPSVATGDGMGLAYRAGAVLQDMEFVQFHPTALFISKAPQFLLSEAMRGEGALLRDAKGELFMKHYHPDRELAPRDVVSRAIISRITETKSSHVYLDLTHLDSGFVKKRFPRIYETCLKYDLDITKDLIPVSPAAHYMMGGVMTGLQGMSSIPGLFAAGEVACTGVHGANRLASNSLLEGLVFGCRAGAAAAAYGIKHKAAKASRRSGVAHVVMPDSLNLSETRTIIRRAMWENVGIIRSGESLDDTEKRLSKFMDIIDMPFGTRAGLELKNILTVALLITAAAGFRMGSVGAHYRSDYPLRGDLWEHHTVTRKSGGRPETAYSS
jgi:L-aspartate oxidase